MRNLKRASVACGVFCFVFAYGLSGSGPRPAWSASPGPSEYDVKAVLLSHFAAFIEWPESSFNDSRGDFAVCVLGRDPFSSRLERTFEGKRVRGHEVRIKRSSRLRGLEGCHIIFVSDSEQSRLSVIVRELAGRSVLTVSDAEGFVGRGGMIELTRSGSKVQFEISRIAIERSQLKVSPKLLKLAAKVHGGR